MFKIVKNPASKDGVLGYEWIEVLAIEPWRLSKPSKGYQRIECMYTCMTETGLVQILASDFWAALEEHEEYRTAGTTRNRVRTSKAPRLAGRTGSSVDGG